ncbi:hypothetical protein RJT34_24240 [Clitoria ternatea]|uniref:Uncharacterized protein n=1 Tax=Clitoria ternatea TaxID=43366 RepID=A0AAN9FMP5_CLITE
MLKRESLHHIYEGGQGRFDRLPSAYVGDMVIATIRKGKPDLRKKVFPTVIMRWHKPLLRKDGVYMYFEVPFSVPELGIRDASQGFKCCWLSSAHISLFIQIMCVECSDTKIHNQLDQCIVFNLTLLGSKVLIIPVKTLVRYPLQCNMVDTVTDNAGVIVNPKGEMESSVITGPIRKECADLWSRIESVFNLSTDF